MSILECSGIHVRYINFTLNSMLLSRIDADTCISMTKSALHCTSKKDKPVGPVAESPSVLLSACVDSEEDGEVIAPLPSNKRETFYYMAACLILSGCHLIKGISIMVLQYILIGQEPPAYFENSCDFVD